MSTVRFTARDQKKSGTLKTQCAVLPMSSDGKLGAFAKAVDKDSAGLVTAALKAGDFKGKVGETCLFHSTGTAARILLIGTGDATPSMDALRKISDACARTLLASTAADAVFDASGLRAAGDALTDFAKRLARDVIYHSYRYKMTVSKAKPEPALRRLTLLTATTKDARAAAAAMSDGQQTGSGINLARELGNRPGNFCTPDDLAREARKLARSSSKASCKVLNEKAMAELGMHSLLSVSAGSAVPARLITLEYKGGKRGAAPHVLVGKGITFDSGGISLKPGAKMDEMKYDMGGAASVLGTMQAILAMELPLNVVAVIAAAENMPSGTATKPGDVVTSMAGITIEILNTDAEGRLVLCDALTYAKRYKPASVVDIATLTGACVVALGSHASGLYANDDSLADSLLAAGTASHDRAWRMPLWDDYQKQLSSNFADVANIGGPGAGSITAACFLARFAEDYPWAHLDIAGTAWDSSPKGATGRPVGLLTQYLCDRAAEA